MRVYTFGCSYTEFNWPTWADILINHAESINGYGENWGRCGAGNQYIASKIWECNARNKFTEDDWVFVCWSGFTREDRFTEDGWITPGNFLNAQDIYTTKFVKSWGHLKHYAMRDAMLINSTQLGLSHLKVNHLHWAMQPLATNLPIPSPDSFEDVFTLYNIEFDGPPMMEFNDKPYSERIKTFWDGGAAQVEFHPLPHEHFNYLEQHIKSKIPWVKNGFSEKTIAFKDYWTNKIMCSPKPVALSHTGWKIPKINQW